MAGRIRIGAFCLLAMASGCQSDVDVLCAVNVRSAERALGQAKASLARSHYEVAKRACPNANLQRLAQQIERVERVSTSLGRSSMGDGRPSPDELLAAGALEAERLGSIVIWAARAWKTPASAAAQATCPASGDPDAGWCDGLTQQGIAVRYLSSDPEAFRFSASFPPSTALRCALFGPVIELKRWTDSSGSSRIERSYCRVSGGPFDELELIVDAGPAWQKVALFSPAFTEHQRGWKALLERGSVGRQGD